jgi:hypothetical protein
MHCNEYACDADQVTKRGYQRDDGIVGISSEAM